MTMSKRATFSQEDASRCFNLDCQNQPSFRIIELALCPDEHRNLVSDVGVSLCCKDHLKEALESFARGVDQAETPLGADESEEQGVERSIALVVVPLSLTSAEAERLIAELKANPIEQAVN